MAQLVECVPNFSEGRNKEVSYFILTFIFLNQSLHVAFAESVDTLLFYRLCIMVSNSKTLYLFHH